MNIREQAFKLANAAARMEDENMVMRTALKSLKDRLSTPGVGVSETELEQLIAYVEAGTGKSL